METKRLSSEITKRVEGQEGDNEVCGLNIDDTMILPLLGRLPVETQINSRYAVQKELSSTGGEADVFLCLDRQSKKQVAVKIYRSRFQPKKEILDILKSLKHKNIVSMIDYGLWNGRFFEVMEYSSGGTLADSMPYKEDYLVREVLPQVLSGLEYLHKNNIIHQDLKPTNLFFRDQDKKNIIIGDFGISSLVRGQQTVVDNTFIKRTVEFAAPELFSGFADREADYYSLGITLIFLLMGESPFKGMSEKSIIFTHLTEKISPPGKCSHRFKTMIEGLLSKERKHRWGLDHLHRWLKGENVPVIPDSNRLTRPSFYYKLDEGKEATDANTLGKILFENPELAKKHIKQKLLFDGIKIYDQALASKISDIMERAKNQEEAYLEIVYTLNPRLPFVLMPGDKS